MEEFGYFIGFIVWCVIWGFVTKAINENKGYEGGFLWGFLLGIIGVIVVACKPECRTTTSTISSSEMNRNREEDILSRGGWRCKRCYRVNSSYMTTCVCGFSVEENKRKELEEKKRELSALKSENKDSSTADELTKYKKLLDDGAITEEEYNDIKKNLLKL